MLLPEANRGYKMKKPPKTDPITCNELTPSLSLQNIKENHPNQPSKKIISLKDLPLELRKKEASKPLYLIRYE